MQMIGSLFHTAAIVRVGIFLNSKTFHLSGAKRMLVLVLLFHCSSVHVCLLVGFSEDNEYFRSDLCSICLLLKHHLPSQETLKALPQFSSGGVPETAAEQQSSCSVP